jgi:hypothetical protein
MSEVPIEGKVVGQIGEATYYEVPTNYEATLTFTRETPSTFKDDMASLWRSLQMGRGWPPYEYTPQQELKDRLNSWLRGDYPGLPVNWKGLK